MRRTSIATVGLLVLAALPSCALLKSRPVCGYAPIVQMADNVSWPIETWEKALPKEALKPPAGPAPIQLEAEFFTAKPGRLLELGVSVDRPFRVIAARERAKMLEESMPALSARERARLLEEAFPKLSAGDRARLLAQAPPDRSSHRLFFQRSMKFPGYPHVAKSVEVKTDYPYAGVADVGQEFPQDSRFMTVSDGTAMTVEVDLDGRTFVFTRIEPKVVAYLGLRTVTARAMVDGQEREIFWQEPAVLEAVGQVPSPCRIQVNPGQSILMPLRHTVFVGKGESRSLAKPGTVRERYDPGIRSLSHPDPRGFPLRNEACLLLTPKFAEPAASAR